MEEIRIFVGGLGGTVSGSDLEKTFSHFGQVRAVDIIRTQARSFAYLDFQPTSLKSLDKLFSLYNGCVWKGGKLRIEKAKEHYLSRLRREWAEDAILKESTDSNTEMTTDSNIQMNLGHSDNPKFFKKERSPLRIYFPRLRKVKSIPFSGSGKHKYSFQRVEVPSLPLYFCDCEEHSMPSEIAGKECRSASDNQICGMNDDEIHLMNSVMNKLFEGDGLKPTVGQVAPYSSDYPIDHNVPSTEPEVDPVMEVDNLVTNIVTQVDSGRPQAEGCGTMKRNQEHARSTLQSSSDGLTQQPLRYNRRQNIETHKDTEIMCNDKPLKRPADETPKDEFPSINSEAKKTKLKSEGAGCPAEAQHIGKQLKSDTDQSSKGLSWVQKSSWKELVGGFASGSFSISQILPGSASTRQNLPKPNDSDSIVSSGEDNAEKRLKIQSNAANSKDSEVRKRGIVNGKSTTPQKSEVANGENQAGSRVAPNIDGDNLQITNDSVFDLFRGTEKKANQEKKTMLNVLGNAEVCNFMRSSDSEKEWTKARAALSGALKKKSDQTRASKSARGWSKS